jgi:hypothetical protein
LNDTGLWLWLIIIKIKKLDNIDDNWLQNTNVIAVYNKYLLICQFLGPSITGYILSSSSSKNIKTNNIGAVFGWMVCCTNISLMIEYLCLNQVYSLVPALYKLQQENNNNGTGGFSIDDDDDEEEETNDHEYNQDNNNSKKKFSIRCYVLKQLLLYSS